MTCPGVPACGAVVHRAGPGGPGCTQPSQGLLGTVSPTPAAPEKMGAPAGHCGPRANLPAPRERACSRHTSREDPPDCAKPAFAMTSSGLRRTNTLSTPRAVTSGACRRVGGSVRGPRRRPTPLRDRKRLCVKVGGSAPEMADVRDGIPRRAEPGPCHWARMPNASGWAQRNARSRPR